MYSANTQKILEAKSVIPVSWEAVIKRCGRKKNLGPKLSSDHFELPCASQRVKLSIAIYVVTGVYYRQALNPKGVKTAPRGPYLIF